MTTNCESQINLIDANTVSIKYIVGGWLTLSFCIIGKLKNLFEKYHCISLGIITNIFTVVVLLHPRMRNSSTHVYLLALSVCNIFLLAGLMISYSIKSIGKFAWSLKSIGPEIVPIINHRFPIRSFNYHRKVMTLNSFVQKGLETSV